MALKIRDMSNVASFAVAACSVVGGNVATGGGLLAALVGGKLLFDCVHADKRDTLQASINKVQKAAVEEAVKTARVKSISQDELDTVWKALNESVYHTGADHQDIMRWNYDPKMVSERLLERLAQKNELFKTSGFACDLAKNVLLEAFTAVHTTEIYLKDTEAFFRTELLSEIASVKQVVDGHAELSQEMLEVLKRLEGARQNPIDEQSKASFEQTIKGLITAQEGARKRAGDKLTANPPDPQGAKIELQQLAAQQEASIPEMARTYLDIGNIAYLNDTHEALEAYIRVTELIPNYPGGWNEAGLLQERLGDLVRARASYQKALDLAHQHDDKMMEACANCNLGSVEQIRGNLDAAIDYYQQALNLDKQLGHKEGMANNYANLGIVEQTRGNLDASVKYYQQAFNLEKQLGRKLGMANNYTNLGVVEQMRGSRDMAVDYYQQALNLDKQLGRKEGMANNYTNLGNIEMIRGNLDAAVDYHQQALRLNKQLGRKQGLASNYANLGIVEQTRGNIDTAVDYYQQSLNLNKQLGSKEGMANIYTNLGIVEQTRGNIDAAVDYYQQSLRLNKQLGCKQGLASNYANLGMVEQTRSNLDATCGLWRRALDLFVDIGAKPEIEQVGGWMREAGCGGVPKG